MFEGIFLILYQTFYGPYDRAFINAVILQSNKITKKISKLTISQ